MAEKHRCDDTCICPIHKTSLLYHEPSNDHACQNSECEHANGMKKFSIGELYRESYKRSFRFHPNGEEIVNKLISENCSREQIDLWFAEADYYTAQRLFNSRLPADKNGTVFFETYKGD